MPETPQPPAAQPAPPPPPTPEFSPRNRLLAAGAVMASGLAVTGVVELSSNHNTSRPDTRVQPAPQHRATAKPAFNVMTGDTGHVTAGAVTYSVKMPKSGHKTEACQPKE